MSANDYEHVSSEEVYQTLPVDQDTPTDSISAVESESVEQPLPLAEVPFKPAPTQVEIFTQAIEHYPQSPVNYLLRAEALIEHGDEEAAIDDLRQVLALAEAEMQKSEWGYINQTYVDRAHEALGRCGIRD